MRVKAFHLSSLKVKLLCERSKTQSTSLWESMKSFSFTFSSKEKVKLICKRSKDVDRGRNLSYNLFKPSSPSPLGRNFKENHFENYIFLNIFVKLQTSKKSILKTTFVLNFKANHLKTFFFIYLLNLPSAWPTGLNFKDKFLM